MFSSHNIFEVENVLILLESSWNK